MVAPLATPVNRTAVRRATFAGPVTVTAAGLTCCVRIRDSSSTPPDAAGAGAYPISSFTWLLLYEDPKEKAQSKAMVDFMKWALTDGQRFAAELGYSPLPPNVVDMELKALERIKVQ